MISANQSHQGKEDYLNFYGDAVLHTKAWNEGLFEMRVDLSALDDGVPYLDFQMK